MKDSFGIYRRHHPSFGIYKVPYFLLDGAAAAVAYSLRYLNNSFVGNDVVTVRRSSDDAERGFTPKEITNGTLENWVNADMPLPLDTATAAAAYSLRNLKTSYTGSVIRVRRSVDNAEADFTASDITDGTLLSWVGGQNLALRSEEFNLSPWQPFTSVVTQSTETTPDGDSTNKYIKVVDDNGGGTSIVSIGQSFNVSPSTQYTASFFLKADGVSFARLDANGAGVVGDISPTAYFGLSGSGVLGAKSSGMDDSSIEAYPNGWYRCSITWTQGAGDSNFTFFLRLASSISSITVPRDGTSSILVWGAQLNEGATAGDYVPTTSNVAGDGHVTTWYDQAGSNSATQATAANQPKIVDAGVLVEENGRPAVDFDGVDDYLQPSFKVSLQNIAMQFVYNYKTLANSGMALFLSELPQSYNGFNSSTETRNSFLGGGIAQQRPISKSTNQRSWSLYANSSSAAFYLNGLKQGADMPSNTDSLSSENLTIGSVFNGSIPANIKAQELIVYQTDQSSNRTTIETNINDYYNIYAQDRDGFVTTWYDQSGNGNDATQGTAASQPKIVNAGSIITSNGYTVIAYDGTNDNLTTSLTATGTMLMGGSDGSAFYEVDINGSYSLLANAANTDHPLNESIRVIWSSSLTTAQKTAIESLITYTDWNFADVTDFTQYWRQRSELTDFPLIDTSNSTSFVNAWYGCNSLTSFPALDVSSGTNFSRTWEGCSSLQDFPANMFDSVTATDFTLAFSNTNLTQTSIDNILTSIDTANTSNGTFLQSGGSAPSATGEVAIDNLISRGWDITVTGGYQTYAGYKYRVETDGGTLYASRACTETAINDLKAL